ncbi:hypothetical protein GCM10025857_67790 [Alicyclobacillus contaminans]|nr:hypothetical protein GCM10025857_67790 [Alicyclobacillus contaminans]
MSKPAAIGYLHQLWWWSLDYAQDGDLSRYTVDEIEAGAEWDGEPGKFLESIRKAGFVDEDDQLHDWYDYAGKYIEQREKDAERKREQREKAKQKKKKDVQPMSGGRPEDIQPMSGCTNQPYQPTNHTNQPHGHEPLPPFGDESELDLDTYCREVESQMIACGANPNYTAKGEAYRWIKRFHESKVPISFVRSGIVQAYAKKADISTFTYCAKVIQDLWQRELAKRESVQPLEISVSVESHRSRESPKEVTGGPYVPRDLLRKSPHYYRRSMMVRVDPTQAEATLCATLIQRPDLLDEVNLSHEDFLDPDLGLIFRTVQWLAERGKPVTSFAIVEKLAKRVDTDKLADITSGILAKPWAIQDTTRIVKDASTRRRLVQTAHRMIEMAETAERIDDDALSEIEKSFAEVSSSVEGETGPVHVSQIADEYMTMLEERVKNKGQLPGVDTGFKQLNVWLHGWRPGTCSWSAPGHPWERRRSLCSRLRPVHVIAAWWCSASKCCGTR